MCAILLISASMVIFSKNPLHSVLFLVLNFLTASMLLFIFDNEFLALFFLIIYLGAIAILFLFVVMMLDIKYKELQLNKQYFPIGILLGFTILFECYIGVCKIFSFDTNFISVSHNIYLNWYDSLDILPDILALGQIFYTHYVLQILIAGLILYIAVIAVSFLTVKTVFKKNLKQDQSIFKQLSRNNIL